MPIQILSDNIEMTPSMKVLAEQKLETLLSHAKGKNREEANVRVVMNKAQEQGKMLVKVEAAIDGKSYFGDEEDFTLESALIRAVDEVDKQYLKDKEKSRNRDYEINRELKRYIEEDVGED
jgi:ribosome-associated translation inhibitor RaiA